MKLRLPPRVEQAVARPVLSLLAASWRVHTMHEERWRAVGKSGRPLVWMLWHEALLPLLWQHRGQGVTLVISDARDGQHLADFAAGIGYRMVRGSSTRGGARALLAAVRELKAGNSVAFTPDGPQGPRQELKRGVIAAAQRGQGVIVPVHAEASWVWRLRSWDRFMIPRPFARVRVAYGQPFTVAKGEAGLSAGCDRARAELDEVRKLTACRDDAATPTG